MRVHEFCAHRAKNLILSVFNQRKLSRIENHADILIVKVELFIASITLPWHLPMEIKRKYFGISRA
jgi:hypothetical protein